MAINRNALKTYAPKARLDFIQAMKNRAALFGITKDGATDGELKGEVYIVEGRPWPKHVAEQRGRLVARIRQTSFDQVVEAVAYTWFNRFLAIRYMEVHDYFDHGFRVLSSPKGDTEPQILTEAAKLDLPGLKRDDIVKLKLDGTQDEVLYRKILIAQCNDLHRAMPFLFEKIEDETELLLPENLLQSDSIVRKLINDIDETEWDQIEIIGWLYQFYISDKKDQVIGKVVKSEDIPAATQLFTPNWIVKYMVQNSLGATWLGTYPNSPLKGQMDYYIEPAEQTPEVKAQLAAITPKSLDPEALTLIDPAVGSGHILVEAYDLFKAIYIERGYSAREAARLILTKNLYGLDIDDRAAQMAGFALLMKARADDRSLLRDPPALNVRALQESNGLDADAMIEVLLPKSRVELVPSGDLMPETLAQPTLAVTTNADAGNKTALAIRGLLHTFKNAKTYGSLITVPEEVMVSLPLIEDLLDKPVPFDLLRTLAYQDAADTLRTLAAQSKIISGTYDAVVANPPYMGGGGMNPLLRSFVQREFSASKADLFAAFIERNLGLAREHGYVSMITMQSWMFLSSYQLLRTKILESDTIVSMAHLGSRAFDSISGEVVSTVAFALRNVDLPTFQGRYLRLVKERSEAEKRIAFSKSLTDSPANYVFLASSEQFFEISGNPIAYWISAQLRHVFATAPSLSEIADPRAGLQTSDNNRFLRLWFEVPGSKIGFRSNSRDAARSSNAKWFPCTKGGSFRRWYGNNSYVVNWKEDGKELFEFAASLYGSATRIIKNADLYFRPGLTWSSISSKFSMRYTPPGFIFETKGSMCFPHRESQSNEILALLNSPVLESVLKIFSPTLDFHEGPLGKMPVLFPEESESISERARRCTEISKLDWDSNETSWDFSTLYILGELSLSPSLSCNYLRSRAEWQARTAEMLQLEQENNEALILAYGLQEELTAQVPIGEVSLFCNPPFRYGDDPSNDELEISLKSDSMRELISYAIGCMMGRYSLAEPGLIYAHAGNEGFDPSRYGAFPADADGIIPLTEEAWFDDDAGHRIEEFIGVAWPDSSVSDNLAFLVDGLIKGHSEDPRGNLRDYLSKKFYTDHLQTYRNRPIYWLFSSGKLKAFECLVYLHRYNEGTLARMRTEYVTPLMGKMSARIEGLDSEILGSTSSSEKSAKTRTVTKLRKQLEELRTFDEELHHLADRRIALDLDDGVKVNYGKFGDLLAFKTKVCGKDDSE